jgi:type I restriction enzyme M protein
MNRENIVQKIWNLCNVLRGDGISYHQYVSELTYLLFLKIAEETKTEHFLPEGYRWKNLINFKGEDVLTFYREMLTYLGGHAGKSEIKEIYAFPTTVFSHSENLKAVINGIAEIDWHSVTSDGMGDLYEGLLAKNSQDARSGAGQYFTPRALVECIIQLMRPQLGEIIQDPATGSGGFLISADYFVRKNNSPQAYMSNPPKYEGVEIEKGTYRICLMNAFLHQLNANIILGDALTEDARELSSADLILANPPFGAKAGSARKKRKDISHVTANKQLAFLQHIYLGLKSGGRAAVVLPDNVLFDDGVGKAIRQELMDKCNLHTILRLPTGIFYSQGVKTNVLFFTEGTKTENVWVYDMRANMPQFGKRTPFTLDYFSDFITAYGNDPHGTSKRKDEGEKGRFRSFTREFIAERNDSLDISWLKDKQTDPNENLPEPEELAAAAKAELTGAIEDLNNILELLASEDAA